MILVFLVVLVADMLWVHYIDYVATYRPILAANFAVLVYGASSMAITASKAIITHVAGLARRPTESSRPVFVISAYPLACRPRLHNRL